MYHRSSNAAEHLVPITVRLLNDNDADAPLAWTHTQCRPLGGGILSAVATVDAMPLHQLIGRRVGPKVISRLHLCVLQCTWSH